MSQGIQYKELKDIIVLALAGWPTIKNPIQRIESQYSLWGISSTGIQPNPIQRIERDLKEGDYVQIIIKTFKNPIQRIERPSGYKYFIFSNLSESNTKNWKDVLVRVYKEDASGMNPIQRIERMRMWWWLHLHWGSESNTKNWKPLGH